MAITINIYYSGKNGAARKFAQEMVSEKIVDQIRAEEGNLRYEYFFPMNDPETVLLIDSWRDQKALDVHHSLALMDKISQLREKYDLHMVVQRYVTDNSVSSDDEKFVRK